MHITKAQPEQQGQSLPRFGAGSWRDAGYISQPGIPSISQARGKTRIQRAVVKNAKRTSARHPLYPRNTDRRRGLWWIQMRRQSAG